MKLRLAGFGLAVITGCAVSAIAGGTSAGSGTQIAPTDGGSVSTYKTSTSSIPGGNVQDSAGGSTGQSGTYSGASGTTASGASGAGTGETGSSFGNGSSNGSAHSGLSGTPDDTARSGKDSPQAAAALKKEKVIDTGDKHFEASSTNTNSQSKDKTFSGGLLDNANDITAVAKEKAQPTVEKSSQSEQKVQGTDKADSGNQK